MLCSLYCLCLCTFFLVASHKLFKGAHKIGAARVKVEAASNSPTPNQRQNAVYSTGPQPGTTPSFVTEQQIPSSCVKDQLKTPPPFSTNQLTPAPISTVQKSPPPVSTNQKVQLPAGTHQQMNKDHNPSYIIVSGLTDSISTEDIVAHFQTARCGGGTVMEVIYLGQSRSRALVGISGIELNCEFTRKSCYRSSSTSQCRYISCSRFIYYALQHQLNQFQHPNQISDVCFYHC